MDSQDNLSDQAKPIVDVLSGISGGLAVLRIISGSHLAESCHGIILDLIEVYY